MLFERTRKLTLRPTLVCWWFRDHYSWPFTENNRLWWENNKITLGIFHKHPVLFFKTKNGLKRNETSRSKIEHNFDNTEIFLLLLVFDAESAAVVITYKVGSRGRSLYIRVLPDKETVSPFRGVVAMDRRCTGSNRVLTLLLLFSLLGLSATTAEGESILFNKSKS